MDRANRGAGSANPQERLKETVEVAKALQSEGYKSIGLYGFCCKSFLPLSIHD